MRKGTNKKPELFQRIAAGSVAIGALFACLTGASCRIKGEGSSTGPAPVTYFIAVDISGSMQTGGLDKQRKMILARLVQSGMNPQDWLTILSYSSTCKTEYEGYAKWEDVSSLARNYDKKISSERGTNPALPLEMILKDAPQDTPFAIVLITDGEIADPNALQTIIKKLAERRNLSAILAGPLNSDLNLRDPFSNRFKTLNETSQKRFFPFGNQGADFESAFADFKRTVQQ